MIKVSYNIHCIISDFARFGEKEFCAVAKKYHILMVPGSSFACPGYVRLAYCVSHETIVNSLPGFRELAKEYF